MLAIDLLMGKTMGHSLGALERLLRFNRKSIQLHTPSMNLDFVWTSSRGVKVQSGSISTVVASDRGPKFNFDGLVAYTILPKRCFVPFGKG